VLSDALLAYLHFIAFFLTGALLLVEAAICRAQFARVLFKVDLGYFAAAILAIATGLARLNFDAKGAQFYLDNLVLGNLCASPSRIAFRREWVGYETSG
jgi:putative membrane protein